MISFCLFTTVNFHV